MNEPSPLEPPCLECANRTAAGDLALKDARRHLKSKANEMFRLAASKEVAGPVSRKLTLRAQAYRDAADELVSLMNNPRERLM